jgi:hypothetical protein
VQFSVEAGSEIDLFVIGKRLVAKDQNCVLIHGGADRSEHCRVARLAEVDPHHFGSEQGVKRLAIEHGSSDERSDNDHFIAPGRASPGLGSGFGSVVMDGQGGALKVFFGLSPGVAL